MRLYTKKSVLNGILFILNNSCCVVFLVYCIALLDVCEVSVAVAFVRHLTLSVLMAAKGRMTKAKK